MYFITKIIQFQIKILKMLLFDQQISATLMCLPQENRVSFPITENIRQVRFYFGRISCEQIH